MLIFWSLVRNSVVLAVYLLFSVACFLTVHEHSHQGCRCRNPQRRFTTPHTPRPAPRAITSVCNTVIAELKNAMSFSSGPGFAFFLNGFIIHLLIFLNTFLHQDLITLNTFIIVPSFGNSFSRIFLS